MNNYFYTESLNLAAWCMANDISISKTVVIEGHTVFYFQRSEELNRAIDTYNKNTALKKFIIAFRDIKNIIKNNKQI